MQRVDVQLVPDAQLCAVVLLQCSWSLGRLDAGNERGLILARRGAACDSASNSGTNRYRSPSSFTRHKKKVAQVPV
jgi:hypothetical protein